MGWEDLGRWWLKELGSDPTYTEEIYPQILRLLQPEPGALYIDLGCGTGAVMNLIQISGSKVIGCDLNLDLLDHAAEIGPVVRARLPSIGWLKSGSVDGAILGLVLEHLEDESTLLQEAGRVTRAGGILALVINHPVWTAPGSSPIDSNGEVLYRTGSYFGRGHTDEPAGSKKIRFYHRTTADIMNVAFRAGWDLEAMEESGLSQAQLARYPDYVGQEQIPRLLGIRWRRRRR
jgi:SAM-dependent methyltransferase